MSSRSRQLDETGCERRRFVIAERRERTPEVEVDRGTHGGVDALAAEAAADADRLRQDPADGIEVAAKTALDDPPQLG